MIPIYFELDVGETYGVQTPAGTREVRVEVVREEWEPDYWIEGNAGRRTVRGAEVEVTVAGERAALRMRPFEMPRVVNRLRLYVEAVAANAGGVVAPLEGMRKRVRLSAVAAGEAWELTRCGGRFPVQGYRWRASTYMNTWGALVPYNLLYYHRGEDFGAIPDRLPVVAVADGEVVDSPVPKARGSNSISVRTDDGLIARYAHMNIETIDPRLVAGTRVRAGDVLGKTGMTWDSRKSQTHDPHLHVSFERQMGGEGAWTEVSGFPFLVDAYLRDYPDAVMAMAGGYYFAVPGVAVTLDAGRSVARAGERIEGFAWRLSDGRVVEGPVATVRYEQPGAYAEEVVVRTARGAEERDFAQVRVYDPATPREEIAYGWAYHTPVRGIRAGDEVLIWNRIHRTEGAVMVDLGDGSPVRPITDATTHRYARAGVYEVTLRGMGSRGVPVVVKMRVVVEGRT